MNLSRIIYQKALNPFGLRDDLNRRRVVAILGSLKVRMFQFILGAKLNTGYNLRAFSVNIFILVCIKHEHMGFGRL